MLYDLCSNMYVCTTLIIGMGLFIRIFSSLDFGILNTPTPSCRRRCIPHIVHYRISKSEIVTIAYIDPRDHLQTMWTARVHYVRFSQFYWHFEILNGLLIKKIVFHPILMKLGEIVVHMDNYNFAKFHQNQMKTQNVLFIARFSVQNFKVSVESWKSYILRGGWNFRKMVHMGFVEL